MMQAHRVLTSLPIFSSCQDCLPYLASAETVHDLLLSAENAAHDKIVSAGSHFLQTLVLEEGKRSRTVSAEAKYDDSLRRRQKLAD